jgi:hypothetical protein
MDQSSLEHINQLLDNEVDVKEVRFSSLLLENVNDADAPQKIKEQVTVLDKLARTIVGTLNKIHSTPSKDSMYLLLSCSDLNDF